MISKKRSLRENKQEEEIKDKKIIKNIISNKSFINFISIKIEIMKNLIEKNDKDEKEKKYLEFRMKQCYIALDSAMLQNNISKKNIMNQYQ